MKNTIKKGLSLVLACMLIMSMSAIAVLAEGEAVTIAMGYVTGEKGQQVVVPVTIGANSNVASGSFAIDFDSTQLEFVEATDGTVALSYYEVGVTEDNANQIGVAFIGEDLGAVDAAGGTLFNLVFLVKADATEPVTDLTFNFDAVRETDDPGLFDVDNTKLTYQATKGTVVTGATADVMVSLGEVTGAVGETVSVPVTITADSYIVSGAFTVAYDSANLAFVDYAAGDIAEVTQVEVDNVADGASEVGVIFSTQNTATPITAAGTIVYINFEILEGAVDSNLTINLVHPTDETANGGVATTDGDVEGAVFVGGRVVIGEEVEPEPTTTTVTFNVTPADATVDFNGEVKTAVDGVATFENVAFGTLAYTVSKEGYVSQSANVEVVADMAAVKVVLEAEAFEPDPSAPAPTISKYGQKKDATYDPATQTITVREYSDYTNLTQVRVAIKFGSDKNFTLTNNESGITLGSDDTLGSIYSQKENGLTQTATIVYKDYKYNLVFEWVDDPTCVNFIDILTVNIDRVDSVKVPYSGEKVITLQVDRYDTRAQSSTTYFALVEEEGASITYRYDNANSDQKYIDQQVENPQYNGFYSRSNKYSYVSYLTGESADGKYGRRMTYGFLRAIGNNNAYVTIEKDGYSTEYHIRYDARGFDYLASDRGVDVNIVDTLPLRVLNDTVVVDNENKTIYFEASLQDTTAGFAVKVDNDFTKADLRPRHVLDVVSGHNLARSTGGFDDAMKDEWDRRVLAKKATALTNDDLSQTYEIMVYGGEDGLAKQIFTVTVQWK